MPNSLHLIFNHEFPGADVQLTVDSSDLSQASPEDRGLVIDILDVITDLLRSGEAGAALPELPEGLRKAAEGPGVHVAGAAHGNQREATL